MHIGLGIRMSGNRGAGGGFSPNVLFASGEAGDWFDPSDLSRMWQDTAGTTPVTADGQTVARIDGQRGVVSLQQSDAAKRPAYAFAPITGRRNLLTYTEDFSNAAWTKVDATVSQISGAEWKISASAVTTRKFIAYNSIGTSVNRITVEAKADGRNFVSIGVTNVAGLWSVSLFNLLTGAFVGHYEAGTMAFNTLPTIEAMEDGWYKVSVIVSVDKASMGFCIVQVGNGGDPIYEGFLGDGTTGIRIRKPMFEASTTATAYQKVNTAFGVTEAGVPTIHWLQFDGTNDAFASAATLDLSGTDKVTVAAGVRKLSDAATGFVLETSVDSFSNNGAIFLSAPDSLGDGSYLAWSRGTTSRFAKTVGFTAPTTNLLTLLGNISGDTITLRVDGDQEAQDTSDQGTGNFGNYTLFVGSRNQSILFFNGNIYFLLIRGALTSGADLTALEGFAAAKTGVTL
jgi:hypothetical protein